MRAKRRVLQDTKRIREQLEVKQQQEHYKFSRLTIAELKTLENLYGKIKDGDGLKALEYEELDELEKLLKKAADPNMPDIVDHYWNDEEEPHDF